MNIDEQIKQLIRQLGTSQISSAAYDTAWFAHLIEFDKSMGEGALEWLRENQMPNGCWGAEGVPYNHDRVICTLAAMIALTRWGNDHDKKRVERARLGLDTAIKCLHTDIAGATVGFEMIVPLLLDRAFELGAIQRRSDKYLSSAYPLQRYYCNDSLDGQRREDVLFDQLQRGKDKKLASLPDGVINRFVTTAFSAEMVGSDGMNLLDVENLQEANGSVGCSPSATAFFALQNFPENTEAMDYLRNVADHNRLIDGGGIPEIAPFDILEIGWSLWNLSLVEDLDDDLKVLCDPYLDYLVDAWKPGRGVGFSVDYTPKDGDDTCIIYETLSRYGRTVDLDAVLSYEQKNHFRCYDLELNPSIGANIHFLGALREADFERQHPSIKKLISFLYKSRILDTFWVDKYQISPYYATTQMIIAVTGFADELIENAIDWILDTQQDSGAWGYFSPTVEETANCLQALFIWKRYGGKISDDVFKRGLDWLLRNAEHCQESFWVCKCLYKPRLIVRSVILSALKLGSYLY